MEGTWRGVPVLGALVACCVLSVAGCGGSTADTVDTDDPAKAFAPVVHLHPEERRLPVDPLWFIARSALWFGDDHGCENQKISVGKELEKQQNAVTDWTFITGLGHGPAYWREAAHPNCDTDREAYRYYANQRTRPYDDGPDRAPGLRRREGYYLDLMDWARGGYGARTEDGQAMVAVPAYYERRPAEVEGEPGLRLSYWLMFAMSEQLGREGRALEALSHEGDWERVDVLLRGGDGEYEPVAVRLPRPGDRSHELAWDSLRRVPDGAGAPRTHVVLFAARGSHTLYPRAGRHTRTVALADGRALDVVEVTSGPCASCARWTTWQALEEARRHGWYGFGGAWGDRGDSQLTTGPLGPHSSDWPSGDAADDYRRTRENRRLRRGG
ncbi:MAG TPA: hypothetical protein VHF90_03775 [Thermoleophilaceae bacterium]|nr:hypothetical protein [Thermoleophilaceae bacterium]